MMEINWTLHRFSGGALAFDLVNTVVWRNDPDKQSDRFENLQNIAGFAAAASLYCQKETGLSELHAPLSSTETKNFIALREAINGYFRPFVETGFGADSALAGLFAAAASVTEPTSDAGTTNGIGKFAALSAMRLLDGRSISRTKSCPNCDWLFLDKSKNQSRIWCDMAVCGNRAKAKIYYSKNRSGQETGAK